LQTGFTFSWKIGDNKINIMKIAIIGAGFGGLAAAWELCKGGEHQIELIEPQNRAGGLAIGFKQDTWDWSLEAHYHHAFDTDQALKNFVKELGLSQELIYKRAKSSTLYHGKIYQVDSALSLLQFKELSLWSRLRTGAVLAFLKLWPKGKLLENWTASQFLQATMGQQAWRVLWEPLFRAKFGEYAHQVNLAWFWGRIYPRTARLGYFRGGWQRLADLTVDQLKASRVRLFFGTRVEKISKQSGKFVLSLADSVRGQTTRQYDLVISTLPSPLFAKLIDLEELHQQELVGLGAMTLLLRLKQKFLQDGTYWLNINEKNWPFLAIVEHDNYMTSEHYGGESLVYVGRYLSAKHPDFAKTNAELLADYEPYLNKLNKNWRASLIEAKLSKAPFAQPVSFIGHSRHLPSRQTSLAGLYWVSMQHIYPFDRGVNYAIDTALQLAKRVRIEVSSAKI
jgi:protoporphyrinogen oxidase